MGFAEKHTKQLIKVTMLAFSDLYNQQRLSVLMRFNRLLWSQESVDL